ncbi:glutamate receptor 2.7-like [Prosopis cineraria]|uniref:glutamate receptor 2.7-like n=1 Tax=Prosopis cineraria TaxID=364024 RepID=UPI00240F0185|nr:glutamate receptor 2.7-like [Prosopis cineraria]
MGLLTGSFSADRRRGEKEKEVEDGFSRAEIGAGDDAAGSLLGGKKLIIGLPKKTGFTQFVDVQLNTTNVNQIVKVSGYSIDVFHAAITYLESLRYNISFEFRAFVDEDGNSAGNYDELVYQVFEGKYDAVVGDVSILAYRSNYVDFTLPYAPSDVKMLVKVRHDPRLNMWVFVRPFSWDLWLSITIFSVFIGAIITLMERTVKEDSACKNSPYKKQLSGVSILWLPVEQAVLPEREALVKNCSRFVLVMWLILAFMLMQSYTASLSSILTINQLQPRYVSEHDVIIDPNINVGYHRYSFVEGLLVDRLRIDRSRVKNYPDIKEYREALDKGSRKGGVDAIFDHISHIKIFLKQYGSNYAMVETRHRIDGFAFAFPMGSNLTAYFSRAILNVRESEEMDKIEQKYFGRNHEDYEGQGLSTSSSPDDASSSLTTYSFAGLFMAIGILSLLALTVSESHIWQKPVMLANSYSRRLLISWNFARTSPLEGGSAARRNVDGEGLTTRESNQNIGLEVENI